MSSSPAGPPPSNNARTRTRAPSALFSRMQAMKQRQVDQSAGVAVTGSTTDDQVGEGLRFGPESKYCDQMYYKHHQHLLRAVYEVHRVQEEGVKKSQIVRMIYDSLEDWEHNDYKLVIRDDDTVLCKDDEAEDAPSHFSTPEIEFSVPIRPPRPTEATDNAQTPPTRAAHAQTNSPSNSIRLANEADAIDPHQALQNAMSGLAQTPINSNGKRIINDETPSRTAGKRIRPTVTNRTAAESAARTRQALANSSTRATPQNTRK